MTYLNWVSSGTVSLSPHWKKYFWKLIRNSRRWSKSSQTKNLTSMQSLLMSQRLVSQNWGRLKKRLYCLVTTPKINSKKKRKTRVPTCKWALTSKQTWVLYWQNVSISTSVISLDLHAKWLCHLFSFYSDVHLPKLIGLSTPLQGFLSHLCTPNHKDSWWTKISWWMQLKQLVLSTLQSYTLTFLKPTQLSTSNMPTNLTTTASMTS